MSNLVQTLLVVIVFVNAMATLRLWREAARRQERPAKDFIESLLHSAPIVPKHGRPTKWDFYSNDEAYLAKFEDGLGGMHRAEKAFFYDFSKFGDVLNHWFTSVGSPWRVQELADNELNLLGSHDSPPTYGRRYHIFHNQTQLGLLEMKGSYSDENPFVMTAILLGRVRLLPLQTVRGLLEGIARYVSDFKREGAERTEGTESIAARSAIDFAIQQVLWKTLSEFPTDEGWGRLECRFRGLAVKYFRLIGKKRRPE
jgi:hypothetical protein